MIEIFAFVWIILPFFFFWLLVKYRKQKKELAAIRAGHQDLHSQASASSNHAGSLERQITTLQKSLKALGVRLIKDNLRCMNRSLTTQNYATTRSKMEKVIDFCHKNGYSPSKQETDETYEDLKNQYEDVVRKSIAKEEQARIKEKIREEQRLEREINAELKRIESEKKAIEKALEKALKEADNKHSEEVERLQALLTEAEEKNQRALSQAQLTKSGHVYVISNIGSFGEDIYKIGMTRRLEPLDRVKELGDASVPFPFDVHMMISCDDAPALERALHSKLDEKRINRVNYRKEFFKVNLEDVIKLVEQNHGSVDYVAEPDAFEWREGLAMGEEETIHPSLHALNTQN